MKTASQKKHLPFYKDRNRLAWVLWNIIINNKMNKALTYIFLAIEYIWEVVFLALIALQNVYSVQTSDPSSEYYDGK
jgi:hypothetical protein